MMPESHNSIFWNFTTYHIIHQKKKNSLTVLTKESFQTMNTASFHFYLFLLLGFSWLDAAVLAKGVGGGAPKVASAPHNQGSGSSSSKSGFFGGPASRHCQRNPKDCRSLGIIVVVLIPAMILGMIVTCLYYMVCSKTNKAKSFETLVQEAKDSMNTMNSSTTTSSDDPEMTNEAPLEEPPVSCKYLVGRLVGGGGTESFRELTLSFHKESNEFWKILGSGAGESGDSIVTEGRMHRCGRIYWVERDDKLVLSTGYLQYITTTTATATNESTSCLNEGVWHDSNGQQGQYEHFSKI